MSDTTDTSDASDASFPYTTSTHKATIVARRCAMTSIVASVKHSRIVCVILASILRTLAVLSLTALSRLYVLEVD